VWARPVGSDEVAWERTFEDAIESQPTVVDGTVYVSGWSGVVRALDADTGETEWTFDDPALKRVYVPLTVANGTVLVPDTRDGAGLLALDAERGTRQWQNDEVAVRSSPPAVYDGVVYAISRGRRLTAYEVDSGTILWKGSGDNVDRRFGVVGGETLYVQGSDRWETVIRALSPADGATRWETVVSRENPAGLASDGDAAYVGFRDGAVVSYDGATGDQRWTAETRGSVRGRPVVTDDAVYASCTSELCYAFDTADGTELWRAHVPERSNLALGADSLFAASQGGLTQFESGDEVDLLATGLNSVVPRRTVTESLGVYPVANEDRIYSQTVDSVLAHTSDGLEIWETEFESSLADPMALESEHLFVGTDAGQLVALDPESGTVLRRHDLGRDASHPVVAGERVVAASEEDLYGIAAKTGDRRWRVPIDDPLSELTAGTKAVYATGYETVQAVTVDGERLWVENGLKEPGPIAATDRVVYVGGGDEVAAFGPEDGKRRWSVGTDGHTIDGLTVTGERLLVADRDGNVYALDASNGSELWRQTTHWRFLNAGIVVDGVVVAGNWGKRLYFLDAETGSVLGRFDSQEEFHLAPLVHDDRLLVVDQSGTLFEMPVPEPRQRTTAAPSATAGDPSVTGTPGDTDGPGTDGTDSGSGPGFGVLGTAASLLAAGAWF